MTATSIVSKATHHRRLPFGALVGIVVWLAFLIAMRPDVMTADWGRAVLLLASLTVVPMALHLLRRTHLDEPLLRLAIRLQLPAALLLGLSLGCSEGALATMLALPWLLVTLLVATQGLLRFWYGAWRSSNDMVVATGMAYFAVGGIWTVCDRAGWTPFGFDREIGLLTAIHFHVAGFALPLLASLAAKSLADSASVWPGLLTIASVPALALGITATHFGAPAILETASGWLMSAAGLGVAWLQLRLANCPSASHRSRLLWVIGSLSLAAAMLPAMLYAARFFLPLPWLDIPLMRAVHGSANAFGFTLPSLMAWHLQEHSKEMSPRL